MIGTTLRIKGCTGIGARKDAGFVLVYDETDEGASLILRFGFYYCGFLNNQSYNYKALNIIE